MLRPEHLLHLLDFKSLNFRTCSLVVLLLLHKFLNVDICRALINQIVSWPCWLSRYIFRGIIFKHFWWCEFSRVNLSAFKFICFFTLLFLHLSKHFARPSKIYVRVIVLVALIHNNGWREWFVRVVVNWPETTFELQLEVTSGLKFASFRSKQLVNWNLFVLRN